MLKTGDWKHKLLLLNCSHVIQRMKQKHPVGEGMRFLSSKHVVPQVSAFLVERYFNPWCKYCNSFRDVLLWKRRSLFKVFTV